jgi:hypothetical protein
MQVERHNPYKEKRQIFALIIVLMIVVATLLFLRFVLGGDEDSWECKNGVWIQNGNPSDPMPSYPCE